ncbi:acyl-CoA dehydrogenase family protein [Natronomonas halophila]|uniref:acyl-CoA dehydrogenase family protein n=1 Tax=Natronomonas halophila TaxID=2747817 RepID=UPI0015B6835A|nr:acyl-CoA dehydrogenase family protein [Natronomonas halophila]QLD85674.1 acyl-CoA dehydrogenase family protein [Natronomonas halophila]
MEYDDPEPGRIVAEKTQEFLDEVVIPKERSLASGGTVSAGTVRELREQAREYGVYAPQIPEEYGGLGLSFRESLPVFEVAGRSLLGPIALRVDAPDEGNMHTLELAGSDLQKEQYLRPLVDGDIKSAFAMTEPSPGAGSDPKMLRSRAEKDGDEWVIDAHKWWTTQGVEADVFIVLARTDPDASAYDGCSLFLVDADAPGVEVVRNIPHMGGGPTGKSHAEVKFEGVRVPEEHLLGTQGDGFAIAQKRLGPARLTHCLRFSGLAERALDVASAYLSEREGFGSKLSEKQAQRFALADASTRLHAARTMVRHAADRIEAGEQARVEVSMAKVFTADIAQDAVDTAVQACGGSGIGKDLPLSDFYESVRPFRIVDGADEVHKRVIARDLLRDPPTEELEPLPTFDIER